MGIARISLLESNEITEVQQGFKTEKNCCNTLLQLLQK
jgi:hypothetical protein